MVKYTFWVQKLLHYTIQHEGDRHILIFDKFLYTSGADYTTARRLSAYMSVESANDGYNF